MNIYKITYIYRDEETGNNKIEYTELESKDLEASVKDFKDFAQGMGIDIDVQEIVSIEKIGAIVHPNI